VRADLHVHSTASDGVLTPSEIVALACARRVNVLAIADHDSVAGLSEAQAAAAQCDLNLVPAVELSAVSSGHDIHLLAYFVDPQDSKLLSRLEELRAGRESRARSMVLKLNAAGLHISIDDVLAISNGGAVGRSHVARALVSAGHAESVAGAFREYIGHGRPFYVAKPSASPGDVIGFARSLGAIPVLAHPGITRVDGLIPEMIGLGLMGIEAYHADHSEEQRAYYAAMAASNGLLATGGTDYHGPNAPNPELGSVDVPVAAVEALLTAGRRA
jgi:predicted metal-dependent phosphoesterase TrpH